MYRAWICARLFSTFVYYGSYLGFPWSSFASHVCELNELQNSASQQGDLAMVLYYSNLIHDERYHWTTIKDLYSDTYNFLRSLQDRLATMGEYE